MYDPWCSQFPFTGSEAFSSSHLRSSVFHSVSTLAPSELLRQGSHFKDDCSSPLVLEPTSLFAVTLTAS